MANRSAERLKKWLLKMGVVESPENDSLDDECARLATPQLADTWEYIINHVQPTNEVARIKKVLLLDHLQKINSETGNKPKLNAPVNSIEDFETLRKCKNLQDLFGRTEDDIRDKREQLRDLLEMRNKQKEDLNKIENVTKFNEYINTVVKYKCNNLQSELEETLESLKRPRDKLNCLKRLDSNSGGSDEFVGMVIEECADKLVNFLGTQLVSKIYSFKQKNLLFNDIQSKLVEISLDDIRAVVSKLNVTLLNNLKSMESLVQLDNRFNCVDLKPKISEIKSELVDLFLKNRLELKVISESIEALKKEKATLFDTIIQKNPSYRSNSEFKIEFDTWFASKMDLIDLKERRKFYKKYVKNSSGKCDKDIAEFIQNFEVIMKQENRNINDTVQKLYKILEILSNETISIYMSESEHTESSIENLLSKSVQFDDDSFKDMVIHEFQNILEIPYEQNMDSFNQTNAIKMVNICYQMLLFAKMDIENVINITKSSFDKADILGRINELNEGENQFLSDSQEIFKKIELNSADLEYVAKACNKSLKIWKNLSQCGRCVPDYQIVHNYNFEAWFKKFSDIITFLQNKA